ncbi:hypothetical protein BCV72DRAFT_306060 [Rhizopus microsporus var. microsporus]|uniref:Uncharacterized protein n=2 Tax=Rhizopus microsporus TaxID=58291 RepID=A0A2G4SKD6_RHIZD|nr:uncharacterized protein RHIMIDRAFT_246201 [Rhizopus microsporus ATCC 52813]ORE05865.1 hypothetical protein BCV72DRAFT_306060 [Rhizopus microsporus var. microsporus]PHZ09230.1 hypothetical protein RHIMIDRAFT_246201 [Rhizopus microsporus ATCC 52813]
MSLIIFGDGQKNESHVKFKGLRHDVSNKIYKQLKHGKGLGELLLLDINKYKTSKTFNSCLNQDLQNLKCRRGDDVKKIHQVLKCNTCNIFWNRDERASKGVLLVAHSIWNGQGQPIVFKRQLATSNVVASSHFGGALV